MQGVESYIFPVMQNFTGTLMNWDVSYWAQKQQKALFDLTDEEVRPYLPLPRVLEGLFAVRSCFHTSIEAVLRVP